MVRGMTTTPRLAAKDPRTVARDIPGIFDVLFPQLAPGVVLHFNRESSKLGSCHEISLELVSQSSLQHAMLFEIAVAGGEQLVRGGAQIDIDAALKTATSRQRRHFDAKIPQNLTDIDRTIVQLVAENLERMLSKVREAHPNSDLIHSPRIPGYQWIASGNGDFSIDSLLIEVKCTNKPFSSSDYRQIMIYWLLSYATSVEGGAPEWRSALLLNPRLNSMITVNFEQMIQVIGAGRSKVDLLELFSSMIGDSGGRLLSHA